MPFEEGTYLIWDRPGSAPIADSRVIYWREFTEGSGAGCSIPSLVEQNADAYRARYLAWLHDLGETNVSGRRVVERLELRPRLSYWWMSLLAEKSYGKSPGLIGAIKMLALEQYVRARGGRRVVLCSSDLLLRRTVARWCQREGLVFDWQPTPEQSRQSWLRRLQAALPLPLQAVLTLVRHVRARQALRGNALNVRAAIGSLTIVDYLVHLDAAAFQAGRFAPGFWNGLVDALRTADATVNWIHQYVEHDLVKSPAQASAAIAAFNAGEGGRQRHGTFEAALSARVLGRTLRDYWRVFRAGLGLRAIRRQFTPAKSNIDFWPLFAGDWAQSVFGKTAMMNCLTLNLIEETLRRIPPQESGLYLMENQPWERALVTAWRAAGHGRLIGVQHATVRYWDLRYSSDLREYVDLSPLGCPQPDYIAINGPAALAAYRSIGFPADRLVPTEALRYTYLADLRGKRSVASGPRTSPLRILILGDYLPAVTHQQLKWVEAAAATLPRDARYILKPHPNCPVRAEDYPGVKLEMTSIRLAELLSGCEVAFASSITSAAVDAYCAGVPVVSMLAGEDFNMSPLRGMNGVIYATSPARLAAALPRVASAGRSPQDDYFWIDPQLPRWRTLLRLPSGPSRTAA